MIDVELYTNSNWNDFKYWNITVYCSAVIGYQFVHQPSITARYRPRSKNHQ